ncbi:polysaccharide pyruvyl transferase family protein [Marinimicrococcus flavescens]|uniref:Polysaccharide pyruvyl transferase family protein n=1 Tax=Marinimicrococcus flavescens TaxID=3031815 RepID=A0AAP3V0G8_9PROT|nr:polysaccharide pyruvyl transferase family protein [Marinimicrococcus flavescens]
MMRILVLGGDADGNLGDRAILTAMVDELHALVPRLAISAVTGRSSQHAIEPLPRGPAGLLKLCRAARRADLVLCGGGGLFQDDDSLVKMPYWALRVLLMRLLAPRVAGYALGVGPLAAPSSRLFARLAFACMERVSVRDPRAREVAAPLSSRSVELVPDPALLLRPRPREEALAALAAAGLPRDGRPLLGVAVRRWFPPRRRLVPHRIAYRFRGNAANEEAEARRLVVLVAESLDRMVAERGYRVLFLPSYDREHEGDGRVAAAVQARMRSDGDAHVLRLEDAALYKAVCGELDLMLAGRMHPAIFTAGMGRPVVGLAYNQKFHGFFDLLGQPERVLDVAGFVEAGAVDQLCVMLDTARAQGPVSASRLEALGSAVRAFNRDLLGVPQ